MSISYNNPVQPSITGYARTQVEEKMDAMQNLVAQYSTDVQAALDAISNIDLTVPTTSLENGVGEVPAPSLGTAPQVSKPSPFVSQMGDVTLADLASLKDSLNLTEISRTVLSLPVFDGVRPSLPDYADPSVTEVSIPQEVPATDEVALPTAPTLTLPSEESIAGILAALDSIQIPDLPALNKIAFEGVKPEVDLTPPEPLFVYTESTYQSDLQDALKVKLFNDVKYGGTGMSSETEQAIIDAAMDALDIELEKSQNDTFQVWSARGYEFAPGELKAAIRQDTTANNRLRAKILNDLAKIKYDAEQRWNEVALTGALSLEKQAMDHVNQVASRVFEAAKFQVQAHLDTFNAKVLASNAQWEAYKTDAIVFGERVKAESLEIERSRLLIETAGLSADLQEKKLRALLTRYESLKVMVALYAEQMNGAKIAHDVQRLKLEGFKELVGAKVAQIGANTAKYNLHQAKLAGNETKARIYATDAEVYSKLVGAKKTEADIRLSELQADLEGNRQSVDILKAALEKYRADSENEQRKEDARIKAYAAETGAYEADTRLLGNFWDALTKVFAGQVGQKSAEAELLIKEAETNARSAAYYKEIGSENLKALANILAQIMASALSSVSASAQVGYSESRGHTYTGSVSDSASRSYSETHTHTYNETPPSGGGD